MPLDQSDLPIILTVSGGSSFLGPLPIPFLFGGPGGIVRPESLSVPRPTRGSVIHTADSAFLDDFGPGVPQITMQGHTGWNNPTGFAGLPALKALEALFLEYLARRKRTADALGDPNDVTMGFFDVLNGQAFSVYPIEFSADRQARRGALLYYYRMRFWVLKDYLHSPVLPALPDFVSDWLGNFSGISSRLSGIGSAFSNIGGFLKGVF